LKEKKQEDPAILIFIWWFCKKFSVPYPLILTIIAVSVSAMKRRGGMGMNLTIGSIAVAFGFVF
jgi:lipopolysaccharide export system permease protein